MLYWLNEIANELVKKLGNAHHRIQNKDTQIDAVCLEWK